MEIEGENISIAKEFFLSSPIDVVHSFHIHHVLTNGQSEQQYNIRLNYGPSQGRCFINPPGGTPETRFDIQCINWLDPDQIKDYSFYRSYHRDL